MRAKAKAEKVTNRIYSEASRDVWLQHTGKLAWSRVPLTIKESLLTSLERIARIRDEIGADALVHSMPPIQVVPELWFNDEGSQQDGCAGPLTGDGFKTFGCTLPAQTATLEDEGIIRRTIVHEFSHCFYFSANAVEAVDAGLETTPVRDNFDRFSDEDDRSVMVVPEEWFGKGDAESMVHHDSQDGPAIRDNRVELSAHLPRRAPPGRWKEALGVQIGKDVIAHVHKLAGRTKAPIPITAR